MLPQIKVKLELLLVTEQPALQVTVQVAPFVHVTEPESPTVMSQLAPMQFKLALSPAVKLQLE